MTEINRNDCINGLKVYLVPITSKDTSDIIRWRNSEHVQNNFLYRKLVTREDHERWLNDMVGTGRVVQWIIHISCTGQAIGSVYLRDIDRENRKCEFGIFIGEQEMLGKGYGTEACNLATEYAFNALGLSKVYLRLLTDNHAAMSVYERAGFETEGVFKMDRWIEDKAVDVVFMARFSPN